MYPKTSNKSKGFTLIELLVVISIIGLLSSIVLASLSTARAKARDASIKQEVGSLTSMMELNRSDYGDYCNLQYINSSSFSSFIPQFKTCDSAFSGTYANKASAMCKIIQGDSGKGLFNMSGYKMLLYTSKGCGNTYSIAVSLNDGKWYCIGSSGARGEYSSPFLSTNHGCPYSP